MGHENDDEINLEEEELDQDGIDDFDFVASSEITKSPHANPSDDSEEKSSGEDEHSSKDTKKDRKRKIDSGEERDKKEDKAEKKYKRSPLREELTDKKQRKKSPEKKKDKDSRDKSKRDRDSRDRSKERDREYRRSENWDHYEPSKERRKEKRRSSRSPDRKRSASPEKRKSPKRSRDSPEDLDDYLDSPKSPETNGTNDENDSKREPKIEPKKEEPYVPSNKYSQRKTSQFAQRLAIRTKQEVKQPQLPSEQVPEQTTTTEEQPRYRTYATSSARKSVGDGERRQSIQSERLFSPQVYAAMGITEYGTQNPMMQTSSRALPFTQVGTPPPPGGTLLPGLSVSLHSINANINHHYAYQRGKHEDRNLHPTREIPIPRTETAKVPEELKIVEERRVTFKKEASRVVVKHLSKYLKAGRIANKEDFKHLSRKLAHKVMKKEEGTGFLMTQKTPKKIKKYVDAFFKKHTGMYVKEQKEWEKPLALQALESKSSS